MRCQLAPSLRREAAFCTNVSFRAVTRTCSRTNLDRRGAGLHGPSPSQPHGYYEAARLRRPRRTRRFGDCAGIQTSDAERPRRPRRRSSPPLPHPRGTASAGRPALFPPRPQKRARKRSQRLFDRDVAFALAIVRSSPLVRFVLQRLQPLAPERLGENGGSSAKPRRAAAGTDPGCRSSARPTSPRPS